MRPAESSRDQSRIDRLIRAANKSNCRCKHAAAAYRSGRLLSVGINKNRRPGVWLSGKPCTEHAEIAALRQVADSDDITVYVARTTPEGETALSKPCEECQKALEEAGVSKVIYSV